MKIRPKFNNSLLKVLSRVRKIRAHLVNHALEKCCNFSELPLLTNCSAGLGHDLGRTNQKLGRTFKKIIFLNALKHLKTLIDTLKTLQMSFRTPYNPLKYLK